jgi:hypothetical protein
MIVWGTRDAVIPVHHAHVAHAAMPDSRLVIFEEAGHFPHHADRERFVAELHTFIETTEPAEHDPDTWRELLRKRAPTERGAPVEASVVDELLATASGT